MSEPDARSVDNAWRYYQHADTLHTGRMNYYFLVEAALLGLFVPLSRGTESISQLEQFALFLVGIVITLVWSRSTWRLSMRMRAMETFLLEDQVYQAYKEAVNNWMPTDYMQTIGLPTIFFIVWIAYAILLFKGWWLDAGLVAAIIVAFLIITGWLRTPSSPQASTNPGGSITAGNNAEPTATVQPS